MPCPDPVPGPRPASRLEHVADIVLRDPTRRLRARVRWPLAGPAAAAPALVVLLHRDGAFVTRVDPLEAALSLLLGVVVLTASVQSAAEAATVVGWAADHAAELGADPQRLVVAGDGPAAALAVDVAGQAADGGWPPIAAVLLVQPEADADREVRRRPLGRLPVCVVPSGDATAPLAGLGELLDAIAAPGAAPGTPAGGPDPEAGA